MCIKTRLIREEAFWVEWCVNSIKIVVFSYAGLLGRKSGLAEAMNRPKLAFAVSPNYLSNETKIYIFLIRISWVVYRIFLDFSTILFCPPLVDIYRYPLLRAHAC